MKLLLLLFLLPMSVAVQQKVVHVPLSKPAADTTWTLTCSGNGLRVLYKAVDDPDNVTRKQVKDILEWILNAKMTIQADSTTRNKPTKP